MNKKLLSIIMAVVLSFAFCGCADEFVGEVDGYKVYSEQVFGNGIVFEAKLRGGDTDGAYAQMQKIMQDINNDMSLSLSSSALASFNNSTTVGYSVEIQKFTYDVIVKSLLISDATNGAFNIAVNDLSRLWNVDTDGLNKYGGIFNPTPAPSPPAYADVLSAQKDCDLSNLECYEKDGKYYIKKLSANLKLDLGAIAKGFSADECVKIAQNYNIESALINISGNLCLIGEWYRPEYKKYTAWEVGITSPRPRGSLAGNTCAIKLDKPYSIVTSGDYSRFYANNSYSTEPLYVCHIINPHTGMPINIEYDSVTETYKNTSSGVISATIITPNSLEADAYATAVCALGLEQGVALMQKLALKGVIITEDNKMALVGISQREDASGVSFTQTSEFNDYLKYSITEY